MKFTRPLVVLATVLSAVGAAPARAESQAPPWPTADDPVVQRLVAEALDARPELKQAEATVRAERERIPQAGALPDQMLSLGIQNDGFGEIMIGEMETSFWSVGLSQGLFWPGKRGLRRSVASAAAQQAEAVATRVRLSTEAEVRRGYVDLLLVRGQLGLLDKLETIWAESEKLAQARYEVGQGSQADMLRAQLERSRLRQQRFALAAAERTRVQALNRLRVRPLDEAIATPKPISDLADPGVPELEAALADALERSPELAQARAAVEQSRRGVELARKEQYPDFSLNAAVMPRGRLDPMWSAGIGVTLPVWSGSKQRRAVAESAERREASGQSEESVRQILRLRTQERLALLDAVLQTARLYRGGLLVQSESTASSTLAQYQVGRVPFTAVLEALNGWIADLNGYLSSLAQAQQLAIAQAELSLDAPPGAESAMGDAAGGGGMPSPAAGMGGAAGGGGTGMGLPSMSLGVGRSESVGGAGAGGGGARSGGGMGGGM